MKKILKNKKGFTLVELIVVIAILGVLAVIMVPAFTGYVSKANDSKHQANAKAWCTAYQAAYADNEAGLDSWTLGTYTSETQLTTLPEIKNSSSSLAAETTLENVVVIVKDGSCTVSKTN